LKKNRQNLWNMGKIRIHFNKIVSSHIESRFETGTVRRSQAKLARTMYDLDPFIVFRQIIGYRAGSVRGVVINKQNLYGGMLRKNLASKPDNVVAFVIGRDDDDRFQVFPISRIDGNL